MIYNQIIAHFGLPKWILKEKKHLFLLKAAQNNQYLLFWLFIIRFTRGEQTQVYAV